MAPDTRQTYHDVGPGRTARGTRDFTCSLTRKTCTLDTRCLRMAAALRIAAARICRGCGRRRQLLSRAPRRRMAGSAGTMSASMMRVTRRARARRARARGEPASVRWRQPESARLPLDVRAWHAVTATDSLRARAPSKSAGHAPDNCRGSYQLLGLDGCTGRERAAAAENASTLMSATSEVSDVVEVSDVKSHEFATRAMGVPRRE